MSEHSRQLLMDNPKKFASFCNGVGSQKGFWNSIFYHFIPDTIWGLDITPSSDIHDVEYEFPVAFETVESALEYKDDADKRFRRNLFKLINMNTYFSWLKRLRKCRANSYKWLLSRCGWKAFMKDKIILN